MIARDSTETIGEITKDASCVVAPGATLHDVADALTKSKRTLAVVLQEGKIEGVVSEGDIVRAIHHGADVEEVWAADIMTTELVLVDHQTAVWDVLELMLDEQIRHVIVSDPERPVVVEISDLVAVVLPR
ncbi:MAG: CBS domain-containing protein [Acidimicrobiales bacterium]|nr:CBS domain-containing protein [Acidimicrobiales bacterium]